MQCDLQRYDKELVVGLTQGDLCLCGYDYAEKLLANCEIQLQIHKYKYKFVKTQIQSYAEKILTNCEITITNTQTLIQK